MKTTDKNIHLDYQQRINRVFSYISDHLDADLSLDTVAAIAFFSPYHFHRIFKFITQETLKEYVTRQRIEKSASDLLHQNIEIAAISMRYGFNDTSSFTRAFKKYYGISPTAFKKQHPNKFSKIRQLDSKNGQAYPDHDKYICILTNLKQWIKMNAKIEIKEMPKMDLAYVSRMGPEHMPAAYQTLVQWGTPQGLMNAHTKMVTIYHDSFKITAADKVRMSACMLLEGTVEIAGEIALKSIEAGKCIVGKFEIGMDEFEKSWTGLFVWMSENGYKKADKDPFEIYHNNFNEHPERKAIVDFCIPIQ